MKNVVSTIKNSVYGLLVTAFFFLFSVFASSNNVEAANVYLRNSQGTQVGSVQSSINDAFENLANYSTATTIYVDGDTTECITFPYTISLTRSITLQLNGTVTCSNATAFLVENYSSYTITVKGGAIRGEGDSYAIDAAKGTLHLNGTDVYGSITSIWVETNGNVAVSGATISGGTAYVNGYFECHSCEINTGITVSGGTSVIYGGTSVNGNVYIYNDSEFNMDGNATVTNSSGTAITGDGNLNLESTSVTITGKGDAIESGVNVFVNVSGYKLQETTSGTNVIATLVEDGSSGGTSTNIIVYNEDGSTYGTYTTAQAAINTFVSTQRRKAVFPNGEPQFKECLTVASGVKGEIDFNYSHIICNDSVISSYNGESTFYNQGDVIIREVVFLGGVHTVKNTGTLHATNITIAETLDGGVIGVGGGTVTLENVRMVYSGGSMSSRGIYIYGVSTVNIISGEIEHTSPIRAEVNGSTVVLGEVGASNSDLKITATGSSYAVVSQYITFNSGTVKYLTEEGGGFDCGPGVTVPTGYEIDYGSNGDYTVLSVVSDVEIPLYSASGTLLGEYTTIQAAVNQFVSTERRKIVLPENSSFIEKITVPAGVKGEIDMNGSNITNDNSATGVFINNGDLIIYNGTFFGGTVTFHNGGTLVATNVTIKDTWDGPAFYNVGGTATLRSFSIMSGGVAGIIMDEGGTVNFFSGQIENNYPIQADSGTLVLGEVGKINSLVKIISSYDYAIRGFANTYSIATIVFNSGTLKAPSSKGATYYIGGSGSFTVPSGYKITNSTVDYVITSVVELQGVVSSTYSTGGTYYFATLQEAFSDAMEASGGSNDITIKLLTDVTSDSFTASGFQNVYFDLNGHTLTINSSSVTPLDFEDCSLSIVDNVGGGSIVGSGNSETTIYVGPEANVSISQSLTIRGASMYALHVDGYAEVYGDISLISDSSAVLVTGYLYVYGNVNITSTATGSLSHTVVVDGGTFELEDGTVSSTSAYAVYNDEGTFYYSGGTLKGSVSNNDAYYNSSSAAFILPNAYAVMRQTTTTQVINYLQRVVATIESNGLYFSTLQEAVNEAGDYGSSKEIKLLANVTENISIPADFNDTIDLNGFIWTGGFETSSSTSNTEVTIIDNAGGGKITSSSAVQIVINVGSYTFSNVTIENTYSGSVTYAFAISVEDSASVRFNNGTVITSNKYGIATVSVSEVFFYSGSKINSTGIAVLNEGVTWVYGEVKSTSNYGILNELGTVHLMYGGTIIGHTSYGSCDGALTYDEDTYKLFTSTSGNLITTYLAVAAASVGTNYFETLFDALEYAAETSGNQIVKLLTNVNEHFSLPDGLADNLDLNGNVWTNGFETYVNNAVNLYVFDSVGGGKITSSFTHPAVYVVESSDTHLEFDGVTIESTYTGTTTSAGYAIYLEAGNVSVYGNSIVTSSRYGVYVHENATMSFGDGSSITAANIALDNEGTFTFGVDGATITSTGNYGLKNSGTFNWRGLSESKIKGSTSYGSYTNSGTLNYDSTCIIYTETLESLEVSYLLKAVTKIVYNGTTTYYGSITEAVAALNSSVSKTITLLMDVTETVTISNTVLGVIDLNGKTWNVATDSSHLRFESTSSIFEVTDSVGTGAITGGAGAISSILNNNEIFLSNVTFKENLGVPYIDISKGEITLNNVTIIANSSYGVFYVGEEGTVNINSGSYSNAASDPVIYNGGTVNITGGTIGGVTSIDNDGGTVNISNATINGDVNNGYSGSTTAGTININGGTTINNTVMNYKGNVVIDGATIIGEEGNDPVQNYDEMEIKGNASFDIEGAYASITNGEGATLTINGATTSSIVGIYNFNGATLTATSATIGGMLQNEGTVTLNSDVTINEYYPCAYGIHNSGSGNITINGATIHGGETFSNGSSDVAIYNAATITFNSGNVSGGESYAIYNTGTMTVYKGLIESIKNHTVYNSGTFTMGNSSTTIDDIKIINKYGSTGYYAITNSGTFNFNGGSLYANKGNSKAYTGTNPVIGSGYGITADNAVYVSVTYVRNFIVAPVAKITYNSVTNYYDTIAKAVAALDSTTVKTIVLTANRSESVAISSKKGIIDLNGKTWSNSNTSYVLSVSGSTITITDSSSGASGKINAGTTCAKAVYVTSSSTFNVQKGTIDADGNYPAINVSSSTVNVSGGWVVSYGGSGVNGNGTLNVTGGSIDSSTNYAINLTGTITIKGGSVQNTGASADEAAINFTSGTLTIGDISASIGTTPTIESYGSYAVKATGGTVNYYNGKLIGGASYSYHIGSSATFNTRTDSNGKNIVSEYTEEVLNEGLGMYVFETVLVNEVAQIGTTKYHTLSSALAAASGKTVTLLKNITELPFTIDVNTTLDLNGKVLNNFISDRANSSTSYNFVTINANVVLCDGSVVGSQLLSSSTQGYLIYVNAGKSLVYRDLVTASIKGIYVAGSLEIASGYSGLRTDFPIIRSNGYAFTASSSGKVTFNNGKLIGAYQSVFDINLLNLTVRSNTHIKYGTSPYSAYLVANSTATEGNDSITDGTDTVDKVLTYVTTVTDTKYDVDVTSNIALNGSISLIRDNGTSIACTASTDKKNFNCSSNLSEFFDASTHLYNVTYSENMTLKYTNGSSSMELYNDLVMADLKRTPDVASISSVYNQSSNEWQLISDKEIILINRLDASKTHTIKGTEDFYKAIFGDNIGSIITNLSSLVSSTITTTSTTNECTASGCSKITKVTFTPSFSFGSGKPAPVSTAITVYVYDYTPKVDTLTSTSATSLSNVCEYGSECNIDQLSFVDYRGNKISDVDTIITLNGKVVDSIDTRVVGTYVVTTMATDNNGYRSANIVREYTVIDNVAPVVTLPVEPVVIELGHTYTDSDIVAVDNVDSNVKVERTSSANFKKAGTYEVTYKAVDNSGNETIITRTVIVKKSSSVSKFILVGVLFAIAIIIPTSLYSKRKRLNL